MIAPDMAARDPLKSVAKTRGYSTIDSMHPPCLNELCLSWMHCTGVLFVKWLSCALSAADGSWGPWHLESKSGENGVWWYEQLRPAFSLYHGARLLPSARAKF